MAGRKPQEAIVTGVIPGSIAAETGIAVGDRVLLVNGQPMEDLIDYKYLISDEELLLLVRKPDGEEWEIEIEKEYDEDLGIEFAAPTFDAMRHCANKCVFCFINQNPEHLRETLYEYDDDYRLSFLYGQFVTLTNLLRRDWERIARLRLSPLYVSVHTMEPELRATMLGSPKGRDIRKHLDFLRDNNITIHAQIVLCPGYNDGPHLETTVQELAKYPNVGSVAVVPVGLTRFRDNLPNLRLLNRDEAQSLISQVGSMQESFLRERGTRFVWVADEIYLTFGLPLPNDAYYETMPQVENGVGIARLFLQEFTAAMAGTQHKPRSNKQYGVVTGVLGAKVLAPLVQQLQQYGVRVQLLPVLNRFFGETITATGLVTGGDIVTQLAHAVLGDELLLPAVMLRQQGAPVFLDEYTTEQLKQTLGVPIKVLASATELVTYLVV